jgi:hypothetical protein
MLKEITLARLSFEERLLAILPAVVLGACKSVRIRLSASLKPDASSGVNNVKPI